MIPEFITEKENKFSACYLNESNIFAYDYYSNFSSRIFCYSFLALSFLEKNLDESTKCLAKNEREFRLHKILITSVRFLVRPYLTRQLVNPTKLLFLILLSI